MITSMLDALERLCTEAKRMSAAFDAERLLGVDAKRVALVAAEAERALAAVKTLAMARVEATGTWRGSGDRSAGHWLARNSGVSVYEGRGVVQTAQGLAALPETEQALRSGSVSLQQAALVVEAAQADPTSESLLLETAQTTSFAGLRDAALRVRMAAAGPDAQNRIHAARSYRSWIDRYGAWRAQVSATQVSGAEFDQVLDAFTDRAFRDAHTQGRRESRDAYAADGLLAMARAAASAVLHVARDGRTHVTAKATKRRLDAVLTVDLHALQRNDLRAGESCEIAGIGPVDLATAREMLGDAVLHLVCTVGKDVRTIVHARRQATREQLLALTAGGYVCNVEGCGNRKGLQIDHIEPYERSRRTCVDDLGFKCDHCHGLKTNHGYVDGPRLPNRNRKLLPPPLADTG